MAPPGSAPSGSCGAGSSLEMTRRSGRSRPGPSVRLTALRDKKQPDLELPSGWPGLFLARMAPPSPPPHLHTYLIRLWQSGMPPWSA
ncbi:hypothetical protein GGTG_00412 [Gaeumannomyces tritici R3-111a-1]|uniref:Uncharacterized protein n=1 Tax=Gaeumannomyces tritici (strain R3-111a-1) TaxID=644352 RepID=J3NGM3_GAET3|nr:hypothetical protein GGTG_00412 [Gaeumannomyces tritici R3-111a-1]EJT80413.1 hypothetical protein GGTG_00412 [Gaeumannomyces tritici R3-111a-1]